MIQPARRASLVVLLLLVSVGTASAECAWALWINPTFDPAGWRLASGARLGMRPKPIVRAQPRSNRPARLLSLATSLSATGCRADR
jgi:hypothetical protein